MGKRKASGDTADQKRKALLKDKDLIETLGKLVIETGAANAPDDVLRGALLDVAEAVRLLDTERIGRWRKFSAGSFPVGEKVEGA